MATAKSKQDKATYRVKSVINHDGDLYAPGDDIELTAAQADVLLAVDALEVPEPADNAAESASTPA